MKTLSKLEVMSGLALQGSTVSSVLGTAQASWPHHTFSLPLIHHLPGGIPRTITAKDANVETQMVYFSLRFSPHRERGKRTNKLGPGSKGSSSVSRTIHLSLIRQIRTVPAAAADNLYQAATLRQGLCQVFYNHFLIHSSPRPYEISAAITRSLQMIN